MKAAAPSLGVRAAPLRTMRAPSGPPIQFHHGVARRIAKEGKLGRMIIMTRTALRMVPQMEKNVAQRTSCKWARSEEFAAAWMEMQAPATEARRIQTKSMRD